MPKRRRLGHVLLGMFAFFVLATLGFAFTIYGELAAFLELGCLVAGVVMLAGSREGAPALEDGSERWRTNDHSE
jgi:hypothetical protein